MVRSVTALQSKGSTGPHGRWWLITACLLFGLGVIFLVVIGVFPFLPLSGCPFEMTDGSRVKVQGTPWIVDTYAQACGFGVTGGMEIRAVNEGTKETVVILKLNDVGTSEVTSESPGTVTIALPNLVDIAEAVPQFAEVKVVYRFTPYDDPQERASYQRWMHNPKDPQTRDWYCKNILAKMDATNRNSWNEIIGKSYPSHAPGETYCPAN